MNLRPIYMDYAATTPVDPAVAQAMSACLTMEGDFGNPSSATHLYGRQARLKVEAAREQIAALVGADPAEIVLTSGATESNNLALLGVARANADRGRHVITSRIEHKSVLDPAKHLEKEGFQVSYLAPDTTGRVSADAVRSALRRDTVLVSIMHVNNEIGVIQDVESIGAICREHGVVFHTDASQAAGKIPIDLRTLPVDVMSFTAHKLYGPKGIGALFVRKTVKPLIQPVTYGGGHERGLRPGTLPTHQIVGFGTSCELAAKELPLEQVRLTELRERLRAGVQSVGDTHLNGEGAPRVPGILNLSFEGVEGESLVTALSGLALSTGSACNSASEAPSYVLRALGRGTQLAQSSLRFSLGRFSTRSDVDVAIAAVCREVRRLRELSPAHPREQPLPGGDGTVLTGEAGGPGDEVWVRFQALVDEGKIRDARFQAYGCPDTLRVTGWLAGRLPGLSRDSLPPGTPASWAEALSVPIEKLGRLLVVEDALNACLRQWPP